MKGDEEIAAAACTDLMSGTWAASLADDVPLGSCDYGDECVELRNNVTADASTRVQKLASETEYCEGREGTFTKGKACIAEKATAKCTSKSNGSLTQIGFTLTADAEALKDAKELCDIGGDTSSFEKLGAPKKTAMR